MKTDIKPGWFLLPVLISMIFCIGLALRTKSADLLPYERMSDALPFSHISESFIPKKTKEKAAAALYIRNDTDFKIDAESIYGLGVRVRKSSGVSVIVMHTHGTEAYENDGYKESDFCRTTDEKHNMIAVGEVLCKALRENGINAVHYTDYCDYPNYNGAYDRALTLIKKAVSEHPEAQVIIDLHRDAIETANGGYYKASAMIDGKSAAQIEFVCGTDGGGLAHPDWQKNMSFQLFLQRELESSYPGLMRPLNLRKARFNQHIRTGSMLVEIGTNANTLGEALYSARLFAEVLAKCL